MKVAVIKLGARISFNANDTSGGNGEARSIVEMVHKGGANVTVFTKILSKDNILPYLGWYDLGTVDAAKLITDIKKERFDALLVINGNVNFFGGAEDKEQLLNYVFINHFEGPVFYAYCDPELTLKQVWPSVSKKEWGKKWSDALLKIIRTDLTYICQPFDLSRLEFSKNDIKPQRMVHYPFEQFPCLHLPLPFNHSPVIDLSYGGTMRGGKRINKMVKFYFNHPKDVHVEMFGKISPEDFEDRSDVIPGLEPMFTDPVKYADMLPKMNQAMAHVVIGDPYYEEINDIPQRAYESIWSSVVTFVDQDMDKLRRIYGRDKGLSDFLYVSERQELTEKIQLLKADPAVRKQLVEDQFTAVGFNATKYCTNFVELLNGT